MSVPLLEGGDLLLSHDVMPYVANRQVVKRKDAKGGEVGDPDMKYS